MTIVQNRRYWAVLITYFLSFASFAFAEDFSCNKAQSQGYLSLSEQGRIQIKELNNQKSGPSDIDGEPFEKLGGLIEYSEKPISFQEKKGLLEVIRLYAYASKVEIKYQDKVSGKIQELLLGLPLKKGYSIDLNFIRFDRALPAANRLSEAESKLVLKEAFIVDPVGARHRLFGSSILKVDLNGSTQINRDIIGRLHDFPGLENYNFKAFLPLEISGSVLDKFSQIAERLSFVDKSKLLEMAEKQQYYRIQWELFRKYVQNRTAHYLFSKGVFKQITKTAFKATAIVLILSSPMAFKKINPDAFDNGVKWVQQAATYQRDSWVPYTIKKFSQKEGLSESVKAQLGKLSDDFEQKLKDQDVICANGCKYPMHLNGPGKMEMSENKYLWSEVRLDPETKKTVTLFYVAKVIDSTGSIMVSVIPVDPNRYKDLINYLQNKGQFYNPEKAAASP